MGAPTNQDAYPLPVDRPDLWTVGNEFELEGYRFVIVGIDDASKTLFVVPSGKRSERRAAVRKVFR